MTRSQIEATKTPTHVLGRSLIFDAIETLAPVCRFYLNYSNINLTNAFVYNYKYR